MSRLVFTLTLALALAACGDGSGTSISIKDGEDGGNGTVSIDANGQAQVKAGSFSISAKLPKMNLKADDFELNGVKLYPGSTIDSVHADGHDETGKASVAFHSPATPNTVRDWIRDNMTKQGFKVETRNNGLIGTTDDDEPFALVLNADGDGKSKGRLEVGK